MANSTSANLKLTVQATGENSGTWGQNTNMLYSKYNNSQIFTLSGPHTISIGS